VDLPGQDPDLGSWLVVLLDLAAAVACLLAAAARPPADRSGRAFWLLVAGVTLALGINKQVDLQAVLLPWGRAVLRSHDLQALVPVVLFVLAALVAVVAATLVAVLLRLAHPHRFRLALAAVGALVVFSLLRTASITHLGGADDTWLSSRLLVLEGAGSALLIVAAVRERRACAARPSGSRG
jgi:hypothetical protein